MPFALLIIGLIMIVTGAKGTYAAFGEQVTKDFTGEGNFVLWGVAIGGIGAIGYVEQLRVFSRMFLVLILVAMFLSNRGFFAQFQNALAKGPENIEVPKSAAVDYSALAPALAGTAEAHALSKIDPAVTANAERDSSTASNLGSILGMAITRNPLGAFLSTLFGSKPAY